ncbi:subunit SecA of protein translocase [Chloropicon primus]|nr:subunit SecA of protein translocase [Chloropicon primus]
MAGRGTDILLGGNPYEMVRIVLLQNLCSALMKSETCPDFSGLSEIINIEIPPELLGLMARAKASAMSECGPSLTLNEVEQLVIELCNFARQILGGGEEQSLALVESKNFSALESLLGTMELPASQQSLPTTALQKFANAAVFLYSYCGEVCSREGDLVRELGGLHVVGTQLHDSRRIDNQLRGRAGRQGDPGSTIFILSLQDDLLKIHGGDKTASLMTAILDETTGVTSRLLDSQLLTLQRSVEEWYTGIRKQVYKYDQFLDIQRNQIYRLRKHILTSSADELMHLIFTYIRADVAEAVERNVAGHPKQWDISKVCEDVERSLNEEGILQPHYLFAYQAAAQKLELGRVEAAGERRKRSPVSQKWSPEANFVVNELTERVLTEYFLQVRSAATSRRGMSDILSDQRYLMLELVDKRWQKHLKHMSSLRNSVSLRVFGQLDPLEEYKVDSAKALLYLVNSIQREIIRDLFSALR